MANCIPVRCRRNVLDNAGVLKIRYAALEILEVTGVAVRSEKVQKLLRDAGCEVDEKSAVVRFPPTLVEEMARKNDRAVTLYGRTKKHDAHLDFDHVHVCSDGNGTEAMDFETRQRRESTRADVARSAFVADALRGHGVNWPNVTSQDVPQRTRHIHDLQASLENTEKHITLATNTTSWEVGDVIELAAAAVGGREELRKRPIISSIHTSSSPLVIEGEGLEAGLAAADAGIPICFYVMPGPGATGPATLAGSVAVGIAEALAGNTVIQLHRPGTAFVFSCGMANLDMKTSTRAGGSPEHGLTSAAFAQMAHHYGFPALVGGFVTTAKEPDEQAAYDKFASAIVPIMAGADMIAGIGLLEDCRTVWLEQLVIDSEISEIIGRIVRGIDVDEESLALDVINAVGVGRDYLGQRHTMEHFRGEHFMPIVSDRSSFDAWVSRGRKSILDRAGEEVRRILKEHSVEPVGGEVAETSKALLKRRAGKA
ncbi:MAG: trimethylamine methyltransferase family protein [Candidatus Thermoplasmatota archaeon]|nr:trimethylamine methyltransferase family protein [Candidatus Thermoplasmatota archaeon]